MQVTGSKDKKTTPSRLSIRIPSGQSLHCGCGNELSAGSAVELLFEGWEVVPYPKALSEELDLTALLSAAGIALQEDDRVVSIEGEGAINYALRLSAESAKAVDELQGRGVSISFATPLARCVTRAIVGTRRPKTVVLALLGGVAHIAYSDHKHLEYAEAIPLNGEEELINLLAHLNQDYELRKARFVLLGKESWAHYKTLRSYFRRVSREE